jgi:transcriptional regulator with XRE-family HTH domain
LKYFFSGNLTVGNSWNTLGMMTQTDIGAFIDRWLLEHNKSQAWLAREIGKTPAAVSRIIKGKRSPSPPTLLTIAKAISVDGKALFEMAGYNTELVPGAYAVPVEKTHALLKDGAEIYTCHMEDEHLPDPELSNELKLSLLVASARANEPYQSFVERVIQAGLQSLNY